MIIVWNIERFYGGRENVKKDFCLRFLTQIFVRWSHAFKMTISLSYFFFRRCYCCVHSFFHQFWRRKLKSEKQIPYMSVGYQKCIYERVAWMGKRIRNTHFSNRNENELKETCQNVLCFWFTIYYVETVITTHFIFGHQRIFINISFERFLPFYIYAHELCIYIQSIQVKRKKTQQQKQWHDICRFSHSILYFFVYWLYNTVCAFITVIINQPTSTQWRTYLTLHSKSLNWHCWIYWYCCRLRTKEKSLFCFVCLFKVLDVQAWENCSNFVFNHIAYEMNEGVF